MLLEVKVALNFVVSYLYNKLPRRRADLFGEELERLLVSRYEGHWYPEAPLRGSAYRCLHLGAPPDPLVELAARRSGLDTEEVNANVPAELSVWIDPYEVSYQIGEKGAVKVLYLESPTPAAATEEEAEIPAEVEGEEPKSVGFNPEAQVFVPVGSQAAPLCSSPTPSTNTAALPGPALFSYQSPATPPDGPAHSSNATTPSPPSVALSFLSGAPPPAAVRPQPITFTTAAFAATKFGSTKMKKSSGGAGPPPLVPPPQRLRSPPSLPATESLKHKPLSLSLAALAGSAPSQLSPNAKEFVYSGSPLYYDAESPQLAPFPPGHAPFDPFSSPSPQDVIGGGVASGGMAGGAVSYVEKPVFVDRLASYNLQYGPPAFQPVVLAN